MYFLRSCGQVIQKPPSNPRGNCRKFVSSDCSCAKVRPNLLSFTISFGPPRRRKHFNYVLAYVRRTAAADSVRQLLTGSSISLLANPWGGDAWDFSARGWGLSRITLASLVTGSTSNRLQKISTSTASPRPFAPLHCVRFHYLAEYCVCFVPRCPAL